MKPIYENACPFIPIKNLPSKNDLFEYIAAHKDFQELGSIDPNWYDKHTDEDGGLSNSNKRGGDVSCSPNQDEVFKSFLGSPIIKAGTFSNDTGHCHPEASPFVHLKSSKCAPIMSCSTPKSLSVCLNADFSSEDHLWSCSMETPARGSEKKNDSIENDAKHDNTADLETSLSPINFNASSTIFETSKTADEVSQKIDAGGDDVLDFLLSTPPSIKSRKLHIKSASNNKDVESTDRRVDETPIRKNPVVRRTRIFDSRDHDTVLRPESINIHIDDLANMKNFLPSINKESPEDIDDACKPCESMSVTQVLEVAESVYALYQDGSFFDETSQSNTILRGKSNQCEEPKETNKIAEPSQIPEADDSYSAQNVKQIEISDLSDCKNASLSQERLEENLQNITSIEFATASGKEISVSESSVVKATKLLKEVDTPAICLNGDETKKYGISKPISDSESYVGQSSKVNDPGNGFPRDFTPNISQSQGFNNPITESNKENISAFIEPQTENPESEDVLDFLLATPPSIRLKKHQMESKFKAQNTNETPIRKKITVKRTQIFCKDSPCAISSSKLIAEEKEAGGLSDKKNMRKMLYPSKNEIYNSLPSRVYNLKSSSDGIICNSGDENISDVQNSTLAAKESPEGSTAHNNTYQAHDSISLTQVIEVADSVYALYQDGSFLDESELNNVLCIGGGGDQRSVSNSIICDNTSSGELQIKPNKTDSFFSTANGQKIPVSDAKIQKMRGMFSDCTPDDDHILPKLPSTSICEPRSLTTDGFFTASGKSIYVTKDSITKAKKMLSEVNDICQNFARKDDDLSAIVTARGDIIQNMHDCIDEDEVMNRKSKESDQELINVPEKSTSVEFSTTGKKKVFVSKDSIINHKSICKPRNLTSNGFFTASGKNISVTKGSITKARQLLSEVDDICQDFTIKDDGLSAIVAARGGKIQNVPDYVTKDEVMNLKSKESEPKSKIVPTKFPSVGFSTASGTKISVSKDSIIKVTKMLTEVACSLPITSKNNNIIVNQDYPPFSADSRKSTEILYDEIGNVLGYISDSVAENEDEEALHLGDVHKSKEIEHTLPSTGFCTANGNKVFVSKDSIVSDEDEVMNRKSKESDSDLKTVPAKLPSVGFLTASGKNVCVSKDSIRKATKMLGEVALPITSKNNIAIVNQDDPAFSAASDKSTEISEDKIDKMLGKFGDISEAVIGKEGVVALHSGNKIKLKEVEPTLKNSTHNLPSIGFCTANGNQVSISNDSIIKARKMLSEVNVSHEKNTNTCNFNTFSTANGKNIKMRGMFSDLFNSSDEDEEANGNEIESNNSKEKFQSTSFLTASGNKISFSKDSIMKAKDILGGVRNTNTDINEDDDIVKEQGNFSAFSTASGKTVNVSKQSILKARAKLIDVNLENDRTKECSLAPSRSQEYAQVVPECGSSDQNIPTISNVFTTGRGKSIGVSKNAISKVKVLFNNLNASENADLEGKYSVKIDENSAGESCKNEAFITCPADANDDKLVNSYISNPGGFYETNFSRNVSNAQIFSKKRRLDNCETPPAKKVICESNTEENKPIAIDERRECARKIQNDVIEENSQLKVKPVPGKLMLNRGAEKISIRSVVNRKLPVIGDQIQRCNIDPSFANVDPTNAVDFKFRLSHFISKIEKIGDEVYSVGDGALMVLADDDTAGKQEFYTAFLTLKGVDKKLIGKEWVYNHYKWVIWKLAASEIKFPDVFGRRYLNPDNVMFQLKYRYDREIDNCHRSALKKIMERDDISTRRLVLCISNILENSVDSDGDNAKVSLQTPGFSLEVTDGWYSIPTTCDGFLSHMVKCGKLSVGQKIIVCAAELCGFEGACPPLEAPSSLKLKVHANSTRRARWDTRLGFQPSPQPFPIPLSSVVPNGGCISCVTVIVARVYPYLYVEKTPDQRSIFRVKKAEEEMQRKHENMKLDYLEKTMQQIENEIETSKFQNQKRRKSILNVSEIEDLQTKEDISLAYETSGDPETFMKLLNEEQMQTLKDHYETFRDKQADEIHSKLESAILNEDSESGFILKRKVSSLLRVRIIGCHPKDQEKPTNHILNVWNPSSEVESTLKEGTSLKIYKLNLSTSRSRKRNKQEGMPLVANMKTIYETINIDEALKSVYHERSLHPLSMLKGKHLKIQYEEVNVVFIVVDVVTTSVISQNVYICDEDMSIAVLKFPGGPKICGAENLIFKGSIISASNLHVEPYTMHNGKVPCLLVSDMSFFSSNPISKSHQEAMKRLSSLGVANVIAKCHQSWTIFKNNSSSTSPLIDMPTTPKTSTPNNMSRFCKLRNYACPPPLPPLNSPIASSANRKFKPPRFTPPVKRKSSELQQISTK